MPDSLEVTGQFVGSVSYYYFQDGNPFNLTSQNFQYFIDNEIFGSLTDATGVLFSAVNEGSGVRVSKFKTGAASRELLALVADAKNPSIYKDTKNGLHLAYEDRTDSATKKIRSLDGGVTFA